MLLQVCLLAFLLPSLSRGASSELKKANKSQKGTRIHNWENKESWKITMSSKYSLKLLERFLILGQRKLKGFRRKMKK